MTHITRLFDLPVARHLTSTGAIEAADSVGDPDGTRTITSIVVLLISLGVGLLLLAIWMWRSTRPDPDFLAPLEIMGERRWRRRDAVWQRRRLDEVRPPGAEPLVSAAAPPEIDEAFEAGPTARGFDDLHAIAADPAASADSTSAEAREPIPRADALPRSGVLEPPVGPPIESWTPAGLPTRHDPSS